MWVGIKKYLSGIERFKFWTVAYFFLVHFHIYQLNQNDKVLQQEINGLIETDSSAIELFKTVIELNKSQRKSIFQLYDNDKDLLKTDSTLLVIINRIIETK